MPIEIIRILKKMCEMVGTDYDSIDFHNPGEYDSDKKEWIKLPWYVEHEWTQEVEQEFKDWLVHELRLKGVREALGCVINNKHYKQLTASMFMLNYGWKTKMEKE